MSAGTQSTHSQTRVETPDVTVNPRVVEVVHPLIDRLQELIREKHVSYDEWHQAVHFMIDVADSVGRDPAEDYRVLMSELQSFSADISSKPMLLVASKVDAAGNGDRLAALRKFSDEQGKPLHEISCVTGEGLEELKRAAWATLQQFPASAGSLELSREGR